MSHTTDYGEQQIRGYLFRAQAITLPTAWHIGIMTAAGGETGGGTEASGGAYARVAVTRSTTEWTAASTTNGLTDNANAINFPTPTASWGTAVGIAIFDAASGGNMWWYIPLASGVAIATGAAVSIAAGALDLTVA